MNLSVKIQNFNEYLKKVRFIIKLIDSFLANNERNMNENEGLEYLILLKGNIKFHNNICSNKFMFMY